MIYILIFALQARVGSWAPEIGVVEFNTYAACKAAADKIHEQGNRGVTSVPVLMCVEKGR